ncbi:MAG: cation:dicarboxylase symporter family transporter [Oscillospiraceae bacterium]|nr:cation:dicarboxylase symporter family transporter [Oscillospiraceae bacterium]
MKRTEKELLLNHAGVDKASEETDKWLRSLNVPPKDALRIRLTMEELLLRICDRFDGSITGSLSFVKRLGTPYIRFSYKGEAYDPTETQDGEIGEWTNKVLSNMGLSPSWSYRSGRNELTQTVSLPKDTSNYLMLGALAMAVILGLLGASLPMGVLKAASDFLLEPISEVFTRLLHTFVGLMVFLSVIAGICGIGSAAEFGRIGKKMLSRFMGFTFLAAAAAVLTKPVFTIAHTAAGSGESQLENIRSMLLDILPSNPVKPFYDGNTLQIIFLAVFIGIILLGIGERSARVRDLLYDFNDIVAQAIRVVCRLLPLFIFSSFTLQIWKNGFQAFAVMWKPLAVCTALCVIIMAFKTALTCWRLKVKASVILRKICPAMVLGFATASSSAAFNLCNDINENKLGIAPDLNRVGNPIGMALYVPFLAVVFVLTAFTAAEAYGAGDGGIGWLITLWIVSAIMSFAIPPVSGGTLACIGILLSQLKIPAEALALAGVVSLVIDFISTGFDVGIRHLELVLQADKLGMLDHDMLRSESRI